MPNRALGENGDIRRSSANVNETDTELFFIFGQYGIAGGELFKNDFICFKTAAADAFVYILHRIYCAGDKVHLCFQANPDIPNGSFTPS